MNKLELFRHLFPLIRVSVYEDEMIYRFGNQTTAKYFEGLALQIILDNALPLTAELSTWASGGYVREISMVVKYAPEMELIEI